jgi:hypothetical protein
MSEQPEFIWACGVFEGEGCIGTFSERAGYWQRRVDVGSTDLDVIKRLHAAFGVGNLYGPHTVNRAKPFYVWRCHNWDDLGPLLERMLPWLCSRRRATAEKLLANPPRGPRRGQTHCKRGHPLAGPGSDVSLTSTGGRQCMRCVRLLKFARSNSSPGPDHPHLYPDEAVAA